MDGSEDEDEDVKEVDEDEGIPNLLSLSLASRSRRSSFNWTILDLLLLPILDLLILLACFLRFRVSWNSTKSC